MVSAPRSWPIPDPRLERLRNLTPFVAQRCDKMGVGRRFFDTVVLKGTFDLGPGVLRRAAVQAPVMLTPRRAVIAAGPGSVWSCAPPSQP